MADPEATRDSAAPAPDAPSTGTGGDKPASYREIVRTSSIVGGASVINIAVGLIRTKVAALILGPSGVGLIGLMQNLVTTAATISAMGFGNVGTRQIAAAAATGDAVSIAASRRALLWGTMALALAGGATFWALRSILAAQVLDDVSLSGDVGWLSIAVAVTVASGSQGALIRGLRRTTDIALLTIYSAVLSTILGVISVWYLGSDGLLLFVIAAPVSTFLLGHAFVARLPRAETADAPIGALMSQWREMVSLGAAFMVSGVAGMLGQLAVRTIVHRGLGSDALGQFQASSSISMTYIGFVLGAMGTDFYPRLVAAIHDRSVVNRMVNQQTEVALLLAGPVLLGMVSLAPWVIRLLYSEQFATSADVLRWQVIGDVLKITSWPLGFIIIASGDGRTYMTSEVIGSTSFGVFTWALMSTMGVTATGMSFLAMYCVVLAFVYTAARRRTSFRWSRPVAWLSAGLTACSAFVLAIAHWSEPIAEIVGAVATTAFALLAASRLALMLDVPGPAGRVAHRVRATMVRTGLIR